MNVKPKLSEKDMFIYALMGCTGVLITATGIYFNQSFLRILPLYNSLVIASLQSRVNRYSNLLGSINSLLYTAVYVYYNLYASALSALLFSFPMQMITFIRWNKNKWKQSTVLRKMSWKHRAIVTVGYFAVLGAMWALLPLIGAEYVFLDSATTLLGILVLFLTMFAFVEYTFCMIINGILSIGLYIAMLGDSPETVPFLIFSVYSFICIVFAFFEAKRLYANQHNESKEKPVGV
ncbi:MAG: nicotinamide mononucleotide transporter [Clostridia bacterium]|nr:nicotinamide mononucleotide transporter [Clostridia bacterium]